MLYVRILIPIFHNNSSFDKLAPLIRVVGNIDPWWLMFNALILQFPIASWLWNHSLFLLCLFCKTDQEVQLEAYGYEMQRNTLVQPCISAFRSKEKCYLPTFKDLVQRFRCISGYIINWSKYETTELELALNKYCEKEFLNIGPKGCNCFFQKQSSRIRLAWKGSSWLSYCFKLLESVNDVGFTYYARIF